ncbi:MAG: hypothetical protein GX937_05650 [Lentisphaerae bacterium]|jgi:uncharacterized repeat protein (TIGR04138 family)|nr:hypothetical protein [Lentisphaerota bacterium]
MSEYDAEFTEKIAAFCRRKPRFPIGAYAFMREAVDFAVKTVSQEDPKANGPRHVSGQELLDKIRVFLLIKYGPMARQVLDYWGVTHTEDFGEIVFDMVGLELLSVSPEDSIDDFMHGFDFDEALVKPFQVPGPLPDLPKID